MEAIMKRRFSFAARGIVLAIAATMLGGCVTLDWSPDGKRFVVGFPGLESKLVMMNADGAGYTPIPTQSPAYFGKWSPDGTRIAYSNEEGLEMYDTRTRKIRQLIPGATMFSAWTEDGSKIITFLGQKDSPKTELVWYDLDALKIGQRIPFGDRALNVTNLTSIPKTEGAVFMYGEGTKQDIYVAEFGEIRRVTTTGDVIGFGLRAKDNTVLFARKSKNSQFILLSMYQYDLSLRSVKKFAFPDHVAGINPKPRTGPTSVDMAIFSPDGTEMLLFGSSKVDKPTVNQQSEHGMMFRVRTDGTGGTMVFDDMGAKGALAWAAWSSNNQIVGFDANEKRYRIWTANANGSGKKTIRDRATTK